MSDEKPSGLLRVFKDYTMPRRFEPYVDIPDDSVMFSFTNLSDVDLFEAWWTDCGFIQFSQWLDNEDRKP